MSLSQNKKRFPVGLMLFMVMLAVYKSANLTSSMMLDIRAFLFLAGLDFFYLALFLLFGILLGFTRFRLLRSLLWLLLVFMSVTYLIDSFVLLALNAHAPLFDVARYALAPGVVLGFFDARVYGATGLLLLSVFFICRFSPVIKKTAFVGLACLFLFGGLSAAFTPQPLAQYSMLSPAGLIEVIRPAGPIPSYSEEQIEFYAGQVQKAVQIPASKPDIILLVVESLSSINSARVSGGAGFLEEFDRLAEKGLLFRNFFANHQASEGGLISLLGGYPPMHFPTATPYMFDEFAIQPSVISDYRQAGYFTGFLTNSDLRFIGMNHYLDGLGFDQSQGRDEIDMLRTAVRVVQDAPSDALLYRQALATVEQLSSAQGPFLLTIATTSTHLPYTHPEGGMDTGEAVWDWSMQQLNGFYRQLSEAGYFERGILLITGDHRQMRPVTDIEATRYGDSARARVPLLVIGDGYTAGGIDERFFQQSDLLRLLGNIDQAETRLSPQPIWVERYNRKYGHIELIDKLSVFDEADGGRHEYRLRVPGNRIEWLGEKPWFAGRLEARIHAQRSLHQRNRYIKNRSAGATNDSGH